MRVASLNLNGARAAFRKGLAGWLREWAPDFVCGQELKAQAEDLAAEILRPAGLRGHFAFAARRGYSGVCVYARRRPLAASVFGDDEWDSEGRFLRLDYPAHSIVSVYMPSGSSGAERQAYKERMMGAVYERFGEYQLEARKTGREFLLCGDFNIAHAKKDIRNWRGNQKNSGFLPTEREWLGKLLEEQGWADVFRRLNDNEGEYTWWSNRGRAWENNVGWRIDYQLATAGLAARAERQFIHKAERFSDHAPLVIDYRRRGRRAA